jgi:Protein of unknown function (DUF2934)
MRKIRELRQRAERYRQLTKHVTDPRAVRAICELANEFDMTAAQLEWQRLVRERAHKLWLEQGCPEGRQLEHWTAAERELADEGQDDRHARKRA